MAQRSGKPRIDLPPEFKGEEQEFLRDMREKFARDESYDLENRKAGVEDLQFLVGDQWEERIRQKRIDSRRPVLTINRLPAFVGQVLGARLENETAIRVLPDHGGEKDVAKVRQGLIRSIQKNSHADMAFDNALTGAVCAGIGNFQIEIDYDNDEVWHQSIAIRPIPDHFSVVWDRSCTDPTGADAGHSFVVETMPLSTFRTEYPWATPSDVMISRMPGEVIHGTWFNQDDVRIVSYWQVRERQRTIALLRNGATVDITDREDPSILAQIAQRPDGEPYIREVYRKYARMYRCSGSDVLEGPYDLPISRVPIFRVPGWEIRIGGQVHRWGLIRHMKDPQRLHNYWRSSIAEKIMQSPRATWLAASTAVAGREDKWRNSNTSNDPLLIYNDDAGQKPERVPPIQVEQALILQAQMTEQDLKDVSNIHEANLGMPSNEVSGRGIDARQRVSRLGTEIYNANLTKAIEECGCVINDLIPTVYDTPRVVRILGDDSSQSIMQAINDTTNENAVDITVGKYSVTVSTGPAYETKRVEQAENMLALAQAMPQVMGLVADLIVEAQDWPKAERIAERIRTTMDTSLLSPDEITPAIQQKAQKQAEAQQQQIQFAVRQAMADYLETQSEAAVNFARAKKYEAETQGEQVSVPVDTAETRAKTVKALAEARRVDTETELLPTERLKPGATQANVFV